MIIEQITSYNVCMATRKLVESLLEIVTPIRMFLFQAVELCCFSRLTVASSHDLEKSDCEVQVSVFRSHQRRLKYTIAAQNHAAGIRLLEISRAALMIPGNVFIILLCKVFMITLRGSLIWPRVDPTCHGASVLVKES